VKWAIFFNDDHIRITTYFASICSLHMWNCLLYASHRTAWKSNPLTGIGVGPTIHWALVPSTCCHVPVSQVCMKQEDLKALIIFKRVYFSSLVKKAEHSFFLYITIYKNFIRNYILFT